MGIVLILKRTAVPALLILSLAIQVGCAGDYHWGVTRAFPVAGQIVDPPQVDPVDEENPRRRNPGIDFSGFLGLRNLGNTCFANALHKLLWADPRFSAAAEAVYDAAILPKIAIHGRVPTQLELREERLRENQIQLRAAFHNLMEGLDKNKTKLWGNFKLKSKDQRHFAPESHAVFDFMEGSLVQHNLMNRPPGYALNPAVGYPKWERRRDLRALRIDRANPGNSTFLRRNQGDSDEYFTSLTLHLGGQLYAREVGGFQKLLQTRFDAVPGVVPAVSQLPRAPGNEELAINLLLRLPHARKFANVSDLLKANQAPDPRMVNHPVLHQNSPAAEWNYFTAGAKGIPERVVLILKRFEFDQILGVGRKVPNRVEINPTIDLDFHRPNGARDGVELEQTVEYRVKAVLVHAGNYTGGHYYTYIWDTQLRKWFKHDDSSVQVLTGNSEEQAVENMARNGYIMLYERNR